MAGTFLPFSQYNHDLARSMNGLTQIYPSRFMTCTMKDTTSLAQKVDEISEKINDLLSTTNETNGVPYASIRQTAWDGIYDLVDIKDDKVSTGAIALGDINFLSHEVMGGMMYSDIYVHVTPELGSKTAVLQPIAGEDPKKEAIAIDPETGQPMMEPSSRKQLTFNAIVLYYNLYQIDPSTKTADFQPLCLDMPLGIYIPEAPVQVTISTPELFGQGTAWSTRICSRFATASDIGNLPDSGQATEYATLTKVLSEFGDISAVMNEILHQRGATDNDEVGMAYDDVKSYLEEFRAQKQVNVPYIKDGYWFVNGRKMEKTISEELLKKIVEEILNNSGNKYMGPTGPQGVPGKQGPAGPKGDKGEKGDQGLAGPQGPQGASGKDGKQGPEGPRGAVGATGPQGASGKDGRDGFQGPAGVQGPTGPRGLRGPEGPTGPAGEGGGVGPQGPQGPQGPAGRDGGGGQDGLQGPQGPAGPRGPEGPQGPQGSALSIRFYGWTYGAIDSTGKPWIPQSDDDAPTGQIFPSTDPTLVLDSISADTNHPFVWSYEPGDDTEGAEWILEDWFYVEPEEAFQAGLENIMNRIEYSYGCINVWTDAMFQAWEQSGVAIPTTEIGKGCIPTPTVTLQRNAFTTTDISTNMIITLERYNKQTAKNILTSHQVMHKILDEVFNPKNSTFNWSTLNTIFGGSLPPLPLVIHFANGIFQIQDFHDMTYSGQNLTKATLYGYIDCITGPKPGQGSHSVTYGYAIKGPCEIDYNKVAGECAIRYSADYYHSATPVQVERIMMA